MLVENFVFILIYVFIFRKQTIKIRTKNNKKKVKNGPVCSIVHFNFNPHLDYCCHLNRHHFVADCRRLAGETSSGTENRAI